MINLPYAEVVPSETTEGAVYTVTIVDFTPDSMACNCKDWEYRGSETHQCKHIQQVLVRLAALCRCGHTRAAHFRPYGSEGWPRCAECDQGDWRSDHAFRGTGYAA